MGSPGGVCGVGALSCFRVPELGGGGGNGFSLPAPGGEQIPNHPPKAPGAKPGRRPPVAHALPAQLWLLLKGKRKLKSHFGRW